MSTHNYNHQKIEKKWQDFWEKNKTFKATESSQKPKFYALDMFPYPSGAGLHVGHPEGYTASDIISRYMRMKGFEVLHPMGWDAFGLPAENYAIKTGTQPKITTAKNIEIFTKQIKSLGFSYDWDREINTTDPNYFKWTQWIFLQLFNSYFDEKANKAKPIQELSDQLEKEEEFKNKSIKEKNEILKNYRLAYEKEAPINFCPSCKTGLANEEVVDGCCERCGTEVTRKNLRQWILRITKYAERLLEDLNKPTAFILHGYGADSQSNFFPWADEELRKREFITYSPNFPNTENPQYSEWKEFFEKNYNDKITENSLMIGHSLGGSFLLRWLSESNYHIDELILIAPALNDCGIDAINNFFDQKVDWQKIKNQVRKISLIGSNDDPFIPQKDFEEIALNLGIEFTFLPDRQHLMEFSLPELLPIFDKAAKNIINWPNKISLMQNNWIGKSHGAEVDFIEEKTKEKIRIFTTRPDTLFGATYFVLAPEHPLVNQITTKENFSNVEKYIQESAAKSDLQRTDLAKEKTGVFTGGYVINPVNHQKIPVWIADYVLMSYGTGAIMAVPGHDQRDYEFAVRFNLPIIEVVEKPQNNTDQCFTGNGIAINSDFLNGLKTPEAIEKMIAHLEKEKIGERKINFKMRDWIFSRQRYWGEPIPIIHCDHCGDVAMNEADLPLELPEVVKYEPSGTGESPLVNITEWVDCDCPKCGGKGKRETNTMPQWAGSSWYWLRFMDPINNQSFCAKNQEQYWGPVDLYVGGAEHAVLHLLYARFWHKVLFDLGYVSTREPFKSLKNQGIILAEDGRKMSKSLGNVVNPDEIVNKYGGDTLRMYEMFMGPFEQEKAWNTNAVEGMYKFLQKIWRLFSEKKLIDCRNNCNKKFGNLPKFLHKTIKKVTLDIENFKFNTAISQMMIFVNEFQKHEELPVSAMSKFCQLLSPFAPHLAEEIWHEILKNKNSITYAPWPEWDEKLTIDEEVNIAIQINGKLRANIISPLDISKEDALKAAKENPNVEKWLDNKKIIKEIYIPNKIINLVIN